MMCVHLKDPPSSEELFFSLRNMPVEVNTSEIDDELTFQQVTSSLIPYSK